MDQYRCLVKHFFERFFNLETVAVPQFEKNILLIQVLALLGSLGFLSSLFLIVGHYVATLEDKCFFISLSMILLGLVAVFEWETLFPDRKDYLVLAPLPIRTRTLFLAKTSAIAAFLLTFTIA
ncbi:MAG TPA: hypothetical protein VHO84_15255, partial [Syntrophorhabdaceae bacterium]|nr:hypothetical protein [Syntrophorhabdaceae bacterium]